ncbi:hypothetical protein HS088_TW12G00807 [Tripterygium wilfordii]|uniref:Sucrase/ferredoxin-like family protein n=1 Tax=Tripterygium wilfordii TaxID=458696 RepID=A0A7J7CZY8_TRIWF|nr:altered inheritance of mitochondria protein 32 [Tripterygium wilfordii]KAF5739598.1 hypothetical protein HS088_TW12G00807 [Tripterygium wilfordii]
MADNIDSASPISDADENDVKYGFKRPEMYSTDLAGTIAKYDRHVFLCYKGPKDWPPRLEASDADPLPKVFASVLKARKDDITVKTNLTIFGGGDAGEFADGDVLIFPDRKQYRGLKESDVDSFVDDVLVNGKPWADGLQENFISSHIFVCAHEKRDMRCGVCGPALIEKLKEDIKARGLKDKLFVSPCSHIGGHKYAGNLIIFGPNPEGKITGHWYGYVTPEDVPELLDEHVAMGVIIKRLWRGQMGASSEDGEKVAEQKLRNGTYDKKSKKREEINRGNSENTSGCCQGANGFSCCRDGNLEVSEEEELKEPLEVDGPNGMAKLPSWIGSWEQHDVLAAAAVVGAVATVAVAYSLFRRSG